MLSSYLQFVKAAAKSPMQMSTVFQTSHWLAKRLLERANLDQAHSVLELGPGAGAITKSLYGQLLADCRYKGIELNPDLVAYLRKAFPKFEFIEGSAELCAEIARKEGPADVVVSSLPWTIFPTEVQDKIMESVVQSLQPGGRFVTYVCINATLYPAAKNLRSLLFKNFSDVHKSKIEWRNIPPAFVYTCTK